MERFCNGSQYVGLICLRPRERQLFGASVPVGNDDENNDGYSSLGFCQAV